MHVTDHSVVLDWLISHGASLLRKQWHFSGLTNGAVDQVRVYHQSFDGQGARPHSAADAARDRRRGDRVASPCTVAASGSAVTPQASRSRVTEDDEAGTRVGRQALIIADGPQT